MPLPLLPREEKQAVSTPEQMAFEMFAEAYPHEAAEADWAAFVAYTRSRCNNPEFPEQEIRRILAQTAEAS
jgi:hypothetical protein